MVYLPTGAFVCPRSNNLGIGFGFHGSSEPSNTYHTPRLGFLNLGIGFGFHGSSEPSNTYHTPRLGFFNLGIGLGFHGSTAPEHILHATFRFLDFRDWFGVSCLYCTLQSTLETTFRVFIHLRQLPSLFRSRGKRRSLAVYLPTFVHLFHLQTDFIIPQMLNVGNKFTYI